MAEPSSRTHPGRLRSVDILRAVAALTVVLAHAPFLPDGCGQPWAAILSAPTRLGRLGVTLFLVISGFCIHLSAARGMARRQGPQFDWGSFWRRRFWRLYPPYLAAIVLSLAIYAAIGPGNHAFDRIVSLPRDLLTHLLMVHNLFADYCLGLGNFSFWTLGLEEQLYALYAVYLLARRRLPAWQVVAGALVVSLTWQCGWRLVAGMDDGATQPTFGPAPFALGRWLKWPLGLWLAWVLGARAAEAYTGAARLPAWCYLWRSALLLALAGAVTSHPVLEVVAVRLPGLEPAFRLLSSLSDLAFAGAAFVVLNRLVRSEVDCRIRGLLANVLARIGVMSYSLYLTHIPTLRLLSHYLPPGNGFVDWMLRQLAALSASLAFAAVFFWLVERHFLVGKQRVSVPPASAPAQAPAHVEAELRTANA